MVIDSSGQHERGWELLAAEEGRALPLGLFKRSFGMRNDRVITELLGWTRDPDSVRRLSHRKEELYRELVRCDNVAPLPGVVAWLNTLRTAGVPRAIASSTPRGNVECVIDELNLLLIVGETVCAVIPTPGEYRLKGRARHSVRAVIPTCQARRARSNAPYLEFCRVSETTGISQVAKAVERNPVKVPAPS